MHLQGNNRSKSFACENRCGAGTRDDFHDSEPGLHCRFARSDWPRDLALATPFPPIQSRQGVGSPTTRWEGQPGPETAPAGTARVKHDPGTNGVLIGQPSTKTSDLASQRLIAFLSPPFPFYPKPHQGRHEKRAPDLKAKPRTEGNINKNKNKIKYFTGSGFKRPRACLANCRSDTRATCQIPRFEEWNDWGSAT